MFAYVMEQVSMIKMKSQGLGDIRLRFQQVGSESIKNDWNEFMSSLSEERAAS